MIKKSFKKSGFTIIELIVTISIFVVLIFLVAKLAADIAPQAKQQILASDSVDLARSVANKFINEIRNSVPGSDGSYSLYSVGDSQIIFFTSDFGSSVVKRVRYYISGNILYKGVISPTSSPAVYNPSSEVITIVHRYLANNSTPVFYYYDEDYDGTTSALSQPVNINDVRYIRINLIVLKQVTKQDTSTFTVTTGATIRNLKTNLGN